MTERIVLYARVSKALQQNPENQFIPLREWAKKAGVVVVEELKDEISSRDTRPNKEKILRMLRLKEVDGVAVWALDRWGRSMTELVLEINEFSEAGYRLYSLKEGMDIATTAGRLIAHIMAALAQFERDIIQERTLLGLARARAQGKKLGRPRKTPPANPPPSTGESRRDP